MNEFKQVIKIIRGYEQNVRITGDLTDPQYYMHASYQQAMRALVEIVRQTISFHQQTKDADPDELNDALFCYNGNIIVFEGDRGRGKTQMMLSFTRILRNASKNSQWEMETYKNPIEFLHEDDRKKLADTRFHVLPPISPSVLEDNQNILFLILSRLYDYASNLLENVRKYEEKDRIALINRFSACLSGIDGIKRGNAFRRSSDDKLELTDLQDISDGAALRNKFHNLVQELLKVNKSDISGAYKSYLVIQIDDADSQIKNGYKAIEDIRKYLLIPNVVIVMSADISFLHKVIIQEQGQYFNGLCQKENDLCIEISQMSRKYIDKLIPPSHMVHLPKIEQIIENNPDNLMIRYIRDDGFPQREEPVFEWMRDSGDWDVQNMLFMLIYRKTGIVFVRPSAYLHNIVPRSIRGLNQLLYLLSQMDDMPPLEEEAWQDSPTLAIKLQEQIKVAMPNLEAFERYFSNDWVEVKFRNNGDRKFIRELIHAAGVNRVRLAARYLKMRYEIVNSINDQRIGLDALLVELEKTHREQEDFLLFFTIRTVLTLTSHIKVMQRKLKTVEEYLDDWQRIIESEERFNRKADARFAPLLAFDYDPEITHLPRTYMTPRYHPTILLFTGQSEFGDSSFILSDRRKPIREVNSNENKDLNLLLVRSESKNDDKPRFLEACMICEDEAGIPTVHFMNLITFMLRIGCKKPDILESKYVDFGVSDKLSTQDALFQERKSMQHDLYLMQEVALLIASNWDVQGYLYKYLTQEINRIKSHADDAAFRTENSNGVRTYTPRELYEAIDKTLCKINRGEFRDYMFSLYSKRQADTTQKNEDNHLLKRAFLALELSAYLTPGLDFDDTFVQKLVGAEINDTPEKTTETDSSPVNQDNFKAQRKRIWKNDNR